jgi:hypothetical protein
MGIGSEAGGNLASQYLLNKDLAGYIPATNQYFRINITQWGGLNNGGQVAISYTRTALDTEQVPIRRRFALFPMYADNARVLYKPHSLSAGSGGVRNSRIKRRKT